MIKRNKKKDLNSILGMFSDVQTQLWDFLHDEQDKKANIALKIEGLNEEYAESEREIDKASKAVEQIQKILGE